VHYQAHVSPKANGKAILAVAAVLSNWHNVLRAINMASSECLPPLSCIAHCLIDLAKLPKPKGEGVDGDEEENPPGSKSDVALPQTLVRIPIDDQQSEDHEAQG